MQYFDISVKLRTTQIEERIIHTVIIGKHLKYLAEHVGRLLDASIHDAVVGD